MVNPPTSTYSSTYQECRSSRSLRSSRNSSSAWPRPSPVLFFFFWLSARRLLVAQHELFVFGHADLLGEVHRFTLAYEAQRSVISELRSRMEHTVAVLPLISGGAAGEHVHLQSFFVEDWDPRFRSTTSSRMVGVEQGIASAHHEDEGCEDCNDGRELEGLFP